MAIVTYPLNDIDFSAESVAIYNSTRSTGIYAGDDFTATITGNDNTITIGAGLAWMKLSKFNGVAVAMQEQTALDMGLPDTNYPRIDAVVLQFDANKNGTELIVKKGTASSSPKAPEVTRTEAVHEIHLYRVRREPSATAIVAGKITDLRLNATYCGLMADAVTRVDTTTIDAQVTALIQQLEDNLKGVEDQTYYASKSYVNTAVSKAAPANLLDNSDFRNPVNQRGKTEYTSAGDIIDQWKKWTDNATVSLVTGGLKISENVYQLIEVTRIDTNKTHTVAIGYADGTSVCKQVEIKEGQSDGITGETIVFWTSGSTNIGFEIQNTSKIIAWAALYEGEYTADTLPEYHPKGYMVEALNCGALNVKTTATLSSSDWSSSAPYSQAINITGMTETDTPHVAPVYSNTLATAQAQKEAWEAVSKAVTAAGKITFYCFEDKPTTDIPIQIEVNR